MNCPTEPRLWFIGVEMDRRLSQAQHCTAGLHPSFRLLFQARKAFHLRSFKRSMVRVKPALPCWSLRSILRSQDAGEEHASALGRASAEGSDPAEQV